MQPQQDERRQLRSGRPLPGSETIAEGQGFSVSFYGSAYAQVSQAAANPGLWLQKTSRWLETSDDTDPAKLLSWCCEDFKPRRIKAPIVLAWLVVQALGLMFQVVLLNEVTRNLADYEETLQTFCGPEHRRKDICIGPAWNMSYSQSLTFAPAASEADFDFVIEKDHQFTFSTLSNPPTFLLGVEPKPPHEDARWEVNVMPEGQQTRFPVLAGYWGSQHGLPAVRGWGSRFEVLSTRNVKADRWTASIKLLSKYDDQATIYVYVVDSKIQHLEDIHSQEQCSFEDSWQNFSERENGSHHRVLSVAKSATTFFLAAQVLLLTLVLYRFYFFVDSGKLLSRAIALKFFVQDFPQQMCIGLYLYSWYASNGLRCQMCLFHPSHCDDHQPFHLTNALVCGFTMLSATSNQLLLQAKLKKSYDSEDECVMCFFRFILFSVSVLPFTSCLFVLGPLVHMQSVLFYFAVGVPALLGWGTVLCVPIFTFCED